MSSTLNYATTLSAPSGPSRPEPTLQSYGEELLRRVNEMSDQGQMVGFMDQLRAGLNQLRGWAGSPEAWQNWVKQQIHSNPALRIAHENPFVDRCFSKPRGYAGDAVMLDFIYRHSANQGAVAQATPRGVALMNITLTTPAPRAVRNRCRLLAEEIDAVCMRNSKAEIFSLACGHLREAEHSAAVASRQFGRFVAMDQDKESVELVTQEYGSSGIVAMEGSVKHIIARGSKALGQFDFVYAAGLYDYLNDRVGARLLASLFEMVKPGGKVWVANFAPDIADVGFMEAVMDWWLIYRDEAGMRALAEDLVQGPIRQQVASLRTFAETESNIVFLELVKA